MAGTDGSVDERTERMGAGYVVGVDPIPSTTLSIRVPVGGLLATTRAEAASLLQLELIRDLGLSRVTSFNLLIYVDCPVVLDITMVLKKV
jgi:hypothetical protein